MILFIYFHDQCEVKWHYSAVTLHITNRIPPARVNIMKPTGVSQQNLCVCVIGIERKC